MTQIDKMFCKRCLLSELNDNELVKNISELIELIPDEKKTEPVIYNKRLSLCRECDMLINGMCRECGCYVELRAIKKNMICPAVKPKWL